MDLTQKQGRLLASIARHPQASKDWHKDFIGESKYSNNIQKLKEHGLIVENPNSGVAKHNDKYFEYQPERDPEFAENSEDEELVNKIIEKLVEDEAESIKEFAKNFNVGYNKVLELINKLESEGTVKVKRSGNKKGLELQTEETSLNEPDYDLCMITGKGVSKLKEFIEEQPGFIQVAYLPFYKKRIVYAPPHTIDKVE